MLLVRNAGCRGPGRLLEVVQVLDGLNASIWCFFALSGRYWGYLGFLKLVEFSKSDTGRLPVVWLAFPA